MISGKSVTMALDTLQHEQDCGPSLTILGIVIGVMTVIIDLVGDQWL